MSYFNYENLRKYFFDYNISNQIEIFDPYLNYQVDISTVYNGDYNNYILIIIFFLYFVLNILYINNIKSSFKKQIFVYCEKIDKIQNENKNISKKYLNIISSMKKIKEISTSDDRSAKKLCLISFELQKNVK